MTAMNQKRKEISSKGSGGRPQTPDVLVKYSRPIYCGIFPFVPSSHPHFQVLAQTKRPSREESPGVGIKPPGSAPGAAACDCDLQLETQTSQSQFAPL